MRELASVQPIEAEEIQVPRQPRASVRALGAIILLHAALAAWFHLDRSYWGDEWGSYDAIRHSYRLLLTHFGDWTTMNYYLVLLKVIHDVFGGTHWLLVVPTLLASCWLIVLVWALSLRLGCSPKGALVAALMTAVNPWLVSYAVTIRSYSLFAAFSTAMLLFLLRWQDSGRWRDGILCGAFGALAMLSHLNAVYGIASVGVLAVVFTGIQMVKREPAPLVRFWRLAVPVLLFTGLAIAAHAQLFDEILKFRAKFSTEGIVFPAYLPSVAAMYFGRGYLMWPALVILALALVWAFRHQRRLAWLLIPVVVPVVMMTLGRVGNFYPAYARFLTPALPLLLILMAAYLASARGRVNIALAVVLLCGFGYANTRHLLAWRGFAHSVPIHTLTAIAKSASPNAKYVLVGNDQHAFGFKASGLPVYVRVAKALAEQPDSEDLDLVVIDLLRFTRKREGVEVGHIKVVRYTGKPMEIAQQVSYDLENRFRGAKERGVKILVARECVDLLRWMGQTPASGELLETSRQSANGERLR